jgi:hypothetical protein
MDEFPKEWACTGKAAGFVLHLMQRTSRTLDRKAVYVGDGKNFEFAHSKRCA